MIRPACLSHLLLVLATTSLLPLLADRDGHTSCLVVDRLPAMVKR